MRHFCTLFDKNYLIQGMALYRSLVRTVKEFKLYVLCMDQIAYDMIVKIGKTDLIPVNLSEIEDDQALIVKGRTTHGQFCWVCQPLICTYILDHFKADMVTYLEADSMFFSDPTVLFKELEGYSVSLVAHRYTPRFDNTKSAGKYCVQFNAFRNNPEAREVLAYWKKSCYKYTKDKPTYYPGQTSLDDWPKLFKGVKEIEHLGAGVAPWNVQQYTLGKSERGITVNDVPLIFYHYHQYSRYEDGSHELGAYPLKKDVIEYIYIPYMKELDEVEKWIQKSDPAFLYKRVIKNPKTLSQMILSFASDDFKESLNTLFRKIKGTYNVYDSDFHKR